MRVPYLDLTRETASLRDELDAAIARVLDSGRYVLSEEVDRFESAFAAACGASHAVGVASGTDAITIALLAAGVGAGDEVITAPNTCVPTIVGIERAGATPVLADVDPATYTLDPAEVERRLTPRTKAILPVHLYGQPADLESLLSARRGARHRRGRGLRPGARRHVRRQPVGSFGVAAAFSFYPTKNLGALGDGGAVVTQSDEIADRARLLRNYGERERFEHVLRGLNSRLDPIQAAVLSVKLGHLDASVERRRRLAAIYDEALAGTPADDACDRRRPRPCLPPLRRAVARPRPLQGRAGRGRHRHGGALSDAGAPPAGVPRPRRSRRLPRGRVALRACGQPAALGDPHRRGDQAAAEAAAKLSAA